MLPRLRLPLLFLLLQACCEGGPGDEATTAAVGVAERCPLVTGTLGTPLRGSWKSVKSASGITEVRGALSGSKGGGQLSFEAVRAGEGWVVTRGFVTAGGTVIEIVECRAAGR